MTTAATTTAAPAIVYYVHSYRGDELTDSHETLGDEYRKAYPTRADAELVARCLEADAASYGLEGTEYRVRAEYADA